jgi:hypothetical protein
MLSVLLTLFKPWTLIRWAFYGVIVTGVGGWLVYERQHLINEGYANAIADIKAANAKEDTMAAKGQANVENCYSSGGSWDRSRGVCVGPAG